MTARPLVAVLDYGIGNLRSAQKALERVGAEAHLTSDPTVVRRAAGLVLPGVGAFGPCMHALEETGLAVEAVRAIEAGKPFLGICVGLQMLYSGSEEAPGVPGLGVIDGAVRLLPGDVKRPQMQWNELTICRPSPFLAHIDDPSWMYFVHSYAPDDVRNAVAICEYGTTVVAAIEWQNVWAAQFHPEKSGASGLRVLENFVRRVEAP